MGRSEAESLQQSDVTSDMVHWTELCVKNEEMIHTV